MDFRRIEIRLSFCVGFGLFILAGFSVLPIWRIWHISSWEVVGERGTFWSMAAQSPFNIAPGGLSWTVVEMQSDNILLACLAVTITVGVSVCAYYLLSSGAHHRPPEDKEIQ